jgi:hypothetical protein
MYASLVESVVVLGLTGSLFLIALVRHYPMRSVYVYGGASTLAIIGLVSAIGRIVVAEGELALVSPLALVATIMRGLALIGFGALLWYELKYKGPRVSNP